jgi:1-acyl-sn-glycerol-3-phosphate acyltransferase
MSARLIAVPPLPPRSHSRPLKWLGWFIIWALRWRVAGLVPNAAGAIVVAGPHSSIMDAVIGFAAISALQLRVNILIADKFFVGPLGGLLRGLGAIPVHREKPGALVDQTVRQFADNEKLVVLMTPEGTRRRAPRMRTGFFHIARQARVPVLPIALHYGRREILLGDLLDLGDSESQALEALCRFFAEKGQPRHPDRVSVPMADYLRKMGLDQPPADGPQSNNQVKES